MVLRAALIWVAGLVTLVPYGTYYLLFHAPREQYALLITLILFWIFGYWSIAGPLLMLVKVRSVFRTLERAGSSQELQAAMTSPDARDVAIDLIATENHIPRFVARRVYKLLLTGLASRGSASAEQR